MDEILIGEKKYVSSKQAAKVTGYAKDYVGQLCREGRVPARLVGRSWYVLESALHDHRFGNPKNESVEVATSESITPAYRPTWQSPRYESDDTDVLPSVNRLREEAPELSEDKKNDLEVAQRLQDTWAAWFDRFDNIPAAPPAIPAVAPEKPKNEPVETTIEIEPEVSIPIRTVYEPEQTIEAESQPTHLGVRPPSEEYEEREMQTSGNGRAMRAIQMFGVVFAMAIATIAVLGSGYVDSYILSNRQAQLIAGVALYNK